jgi:hypothetical protein
MLKQINGNGIAFCVFTLATALVEIYTTKGAGGLWTLVVLWAIFGEFKTKEQE